MLPQPTPHLGPSHCSRHKLWQLQLATIGARPAMWGQSGYYINYAFHLLPFEVSVKDDNDIVKSFFKLFPLLGRWHFVNMDPWMEIRWHNGIMSCEGRWLSGLDSNSKSLKWEAFMWSNNVNSATMSTMWQMLDMCKALEAFAKNGSWLELKV